MIRWVTETLGTASFNEVIEQADLHVIDVRDLVDKRGNHVEIVKLKIDQAVDNLQKGKKIIVCCDYGMSRSNAIAAGILSEFEKIEFDLAVERVMAKTGESSIKLEVLSMVRQAVTDHLNKSPDVKKSIMILGSTGFIGRKLKNALENKYHITAPLKKDINLLTDHVRLDMLVKQNMTDTIILLANPRIYTVNTAMGESLTILKNVIDVCVENHLKLVFPSSWEIYSGYKASYLLAGEQLPPLPKGSYGETKYLCEQLIHHYFLQHNMDYLIFRSSPVYGETSDRPMFMHNFIQKALKHEKIITHKYINDYPYLDLLYIDDLIAALEKMIEADLSGEVNIGSGSITSTLDVAKLITQNTQSSAAIESCQINEYCPNIVMDSSKLYHLTKWIPQIPLSDGLNRIISKYK